MNAHVEDAVMKALGSAVVGVLLCWVLLWAGSLLLGSVLLVSVGSAVGIAACIGLFSRLERRVQGASAPGMLRPMACGAVAAALAGVLIVGLEPTASSWWLCLAQGVTAGGGTSLLIELQGPPRQL